MKILCLKCNSNLDANLDNFYFSQEKFQLPCKACKKIYRDKNKTKRAEWSLNFRKNNAEKIKNEKKVYRLKNKLKIKIREKKYRENNADKIKLKQQIYYESNVEKKKIYNENNRHRINQRERHRLNNDINFRLRKSVSSSVGEMIKKQNNSKNNQSILKYLSYSIDDLKRHIENLFEPWMNWNNRGIYNRDTWDDSDPSTWRWQLDHIIPQFDLPYDSMDHENFQKCWALENLRPYSAKQNILDGVRKTRHKKI